MLFKRPVFWNVGRGQVQVMLLEGSVWRDVRWLEV
jgi:hypothetical protein